MLDVDGLNVQSLVFVGQGYDCFAFAFFILLNLFGDLTPDHAWQSIAIALFLCLEIELVLEAFVGIGVAVGWQVLFDIGGALEGVAVVALLSLFVGNKMIFEFVLDELLVIENMP